MKSARHQAILDLIEQHPIDRQEDLLALAAEERGDGDEQGEQQHAHEQPAQQMAARVLFAVGNRREQSGEALQHGRLRFGCGGVGTGRRGQRPQSMSCFLVL